MYDRVLGCAFLLLQLLFMSVSILFNTDQLLCRAEKEEKMALST
jgi:hypothetical protein